MRRCALIVMGLGLVLAGCTAAHAPAPAPAPPPAPASPAEPAPKTLAAIHFADALHGRATGTTTLTTADGGRTWALGNALDSSGVAAIAPPPGLPSDSDSWCLAGTDTFLATSGAGVLRAQAESQAWAPAFGAPLPGNADEWHGKIQCRGRSAWVLFIGGAGMSHQAYAAFRSPDAGDTWAPILASGWGLPVRPNNQATQTIDAYAGPFDVVDEQTAVFLGSCAPCKNWGTTSITTTTDGGRTWQHYEIAGIREVNALSFEDAKHGWIVAYDRTTGSMILATADGGETWERQYPPAP